MPDTQTDTSSPPPLPGAGGPPAIGDMTSDKFDKFDKIVGQEADLYKRKIGAEGAAQAQYDTLHKQARSRMEGLINQEAASAEDLKPWDVNKEIEKTKTSLWDQFGSPGFIIAMVGSAFSAMPMNTAFEAGAAAINAQHQGKMDAYNKAFDAWKANTDLTMKRLDIEHREFEDVDKLWATDREAWKQRMESTLLRFNDQRKLLLLRNGMDQELMDSIAAQQKARQQIGIAAQGIMENDLRRQLTQADPDWPIGPDGKPKQGEDGKPMRPDPQKMAGVVQRVEDRMRGIEGKTLSPDQEFMLKWHQEHPTGSSEQFAKDYGAFRAAQYGGMRGAGPALASVPAVLDQWAEARGGKIVTPEMKAIIENAYATKGSVAGPRIAQIGSALADIKRRLEAGEQLDDAAQEKILRDHVSQAPNANADDLLDDKAVKLMADQYLAGDKSVFTNLGRGAQSSKNIAKVRKAIAEEAEKQGLTGIDVALRMAEFNGIMASERTLGTRVGNIEMFANEAKNVINVAKKASLDVPRGEFIPFNRAMQAFEKNTGDPKVVALGAALNAVVNTYAKAINGGAQGTVSDKEHAREIVEMAYSQHQIDAVFNILEKELEAARAAPGQVKQGIRDLAKDRNLGGDIVPPQNTIRYDADGNRISQ